MTESSILIVANMHRSGSSLVASLLQSAGLHIGRQLMQPSEGNIRGYFENLDFCKFHLDLLESQGIDQDGWTLQEKIEVEDRFVDIAKELVARNSLSRNWGWKDPRTTLFLDFWGELLPEANFLLVYRSPWEVVDSLYRRGDTFFHDKPGLAAKMWWHYNQKILNFYNRFSSRCLLVNLNAIVTHPQNFIEAVNHQFQTNLVAPEVSLYDPSLLHIQGLDSYRPTLIDRYFPKVTQILQELDVRAWQPDGGPNFQWKESIKGSLYRFWAFQDWRNICHLEKENEHFYSTIEQQEIQSNLVNTELEPGRSLLNQIHQTQEKSQQKQAELDRIKAEFDQLQGRQHQTQEELAQSQNRLLQTQNQLYQTEEVLEQPQAQLHELQLEFDQLRTTLLQTEELLERSQSQLHQTEHVLEEYQAKLHENVVITEQFHIQQHKLQSELKQYQIREQRTEKLLEQAQNQLDQTHVKVEQLQAELQLSHNQFQLTQIELEKQRNKVAKFERSQVKETLASNPKKKEYIQYELLVWDAWYALQDGNASKMQEYLELSLRLTPFLRAETPIKWLERFQELSSERGISIDTHSLTQVNGSK
jgi:hypothetical protein